MFNDRKKVFKEAYFNLDSSLNAVVVFNLEVTHAARFALKTTSAFNEEHKKEKSPKDHEKSILGENARFFGENCEIVTKICATFATLPVGAGGESLEKKS